MVHARVNDPCLVGWLLGWLLGAHMALLWARTHTQSYSTTEEGLLNEFKVYGPIRHVHIVRDQAGKSRGYGFVEFERERDMKSTRAQAARVCVRAIPILMYPMQLRTNKPMASESTAAECWWMSSAAERYPTGDREGSAVVWEPRARAARMLIRSLLAGTTSHTQRCMLVLSRC